MLLSAKPTRFGHYILKLHSEGTIFQMKNLPVKITFKLQYPKQQLNTLGHLQYKLNTLPMNANLHYLRYSASSLDDPTGSPYFSFCPG